MTKHNDGVCTNRQKTKRQHAGEIQFVEPVTDLMEGHQEATDGQPELVLFADLDYQASRLKYYSAVENVIEQEETGMLI